MPKYWLAVSRMSSSPQNEITILTVEGTGIGDRFLAQPEACGEGVGVAAGSVGVTASDAASEPAGAFAQAPRMSAVAKQIGQRHRRLKLCSVPRIFTTSPMSDIFPRAATKGELFLIFVSE